MKSSCRFLSNRDYSCDCLECSGRAPLLAKIEELKAQIVADSKWGHEHEMAGATKERKRIVALLRKWAGEPMSEVDRWNELVSFLEGALIASYDGPKTVCDTVSMCLGKAIKMRTEAILHSFDDAKEELNMKTSREWWNETKGNEESLTHWLKRQYVGELAAVHLLSELLLRFGCDMNQLQWTNIHKVMQQEALHASWMKRLLDARGIVPERESETSARYWKEVLPSVDTFEKACAAAFDAEHMRLFRIREIAYDTTAPHDIREVFLAILPHEEWHEEVFASLRGSARLDAEHENGLKSLSLVLS